MVFLCLKLKSKARKKIKENADFDKDRHMDVHQKKSPVNFFIISFCFFFSLSKYLFVRKFTKGHKFKEWKSNMDFFLKIQKFRLPYLLLASMRGDFFQRRGVILLWNKT